MNWLPIARILLRYLSGALISAGIVPNEIGQVIATDPDLVLVASGALTAAASEIGYAIAKRKGGAL